MADVSVKVIDSITTHLLLQETSFSLGAFLDYNPVNAALMRAALAALDVYLAHIEATQTTGNLTPTDAQQALVYAWQLSAASGATIRV